MDILVEFEDFNLSTGIPPRLLKLGEDIAEGLGEASLPPSGELEGASLPLSLRRGGWGVRLVSTNSLLSLLAVPLPMAIASILYVRIILCRASVACLT